MLDFQELTQRPAVRRVLARVRELTPLPVRIRHMAEWTPTDPAHPPVLPSPAMHPTDTGFDVYLDETLPEQMAVHELLHIVLVEEGYPDVRFHAARAPAKSPHRHEFEAWHDHLVNKLQHPEIYRRMADEYGQDMRPYQEHVSAGLIGPKTFDLGRGPLSTPFGRQTALVDLLDQLALLPGSAAAIDRYRRIAPALLASAERLHAKLDRIGCRTPQDALRCMETFVEHVTAFGVADGAGLDNKLWGALEWYLPAK